MMNFSALIPLRIGSKGIRKKNIKKIAGKPLCEWVIRAACESEHVAASQSGAAARGFVPCRHVRRRGCTASPADQLARLAAESSAAKGMTDTAFIACRL